MVRLAGDLHLAVHTAVGWDRARLRRIDHPGDRLHTRKQRLEKSAYLRGCFVAILGQRQLRLQDVVRLQSQMHLAQRHKTSHQEPRADQQCQRHCHFHDHDGIAHPPGAKSADHSLAAVA